MVEVNSRVSAAWSKWRSLTGVLCDKETPKRLKSKIYRAVIRPVAMYGAECWPANKEVETRLSVMETKMLRWTAGVTRMDAFETMLFSRSSKFGVAPIADKMREARLRWYGHVLRGKEDSVRKIGLNFVIFFIDKEFRRAPAYIIMTHIGVADALQLLIHIYSGVLVIVNADMSAISNKVIGAILTGLWFTMLAFTLFLTFNRLTTVLLHKWFPVLLSPTITYMLFFLSYLGFIVPLALKLTPHCNYVFDPDTFSWSYLPTDRPLSIVMSEMGQHRWGMRPLRDHGSANAGESLKITKSVCLRKHSSWYAKKQEQYVHKATAGPRTAKSKVILDDYFDHFDTHVHLSHAIFRRMHRATSPPFQEPAHHLIG
ncbi:unnamed protein product [Heligmosomoides polygyrus]|uniref:7TM_GPCR_Srx domain-containing protein n=1 Tax=Heligmosomoides polygyrus TaxID=6339 RepID=A0A183F592_HELPZ|nr:unnamed protein product [Heligmosomoides polygyrus]